MVSTMVLKAVSAGSAKEQAPCSSMPMEGRRSSVHAEAHGEICKLPGGRRMVQLDPFRHGRQTKPFSSARSELAAVQ